MQLAARRPHITAGVALASAAVIAAGPMTQHLPKFDVAQHLPAVSVSGIQLTDAAESMMDLFSGVESQLASLAGGGAAVATVPAAALTDILSPITQNLIVETWATTGTETAAQLQQLYNLWSQQPFPIAQQVGANWVQYASQYVGTYQSAANAAVNYFTGTGTTNFVGRMNSAFAALAAGKISTATSDIFQALYAVPLQNIGLQFASIPALLVPITQNLANATNQIFTTGALYSVLSVLGQWVLLQPPTELAAGFGAGMQGAYDAWQAGDMVGAVTNVLNTPGLMVQRMLNGAPNAKGVWTSGLLSGINCVTPKICNPSGTLSVLIQDVMPQFAKVIQAPGAQPIATGGSIATALQNFGNQLISGWPALPAQGGALGPFVSSNLAGFGSQLTALLQSIPSVLSNLPSMLSNFGGALAGQIGSWVAALLRLL